MAVKNELELESFDDFAERLQDEENRRHPKTAEKLNQKPVAEQQTTSRTLPQAKRYHRRTTGPVVISIEEYKERVKNGNLPVPEERRTYGSNTQNNSSKKVNQGNEKQNTVSPAKKKIKIRKPKKASDKKTKSEAKTKNELYEDKQKQRKIDKVSEQIKRNVARQTRYTEPKKRNLLSRIILQQNLANGEYNYIEDDYDTLSPREIEESKNAKKRRDRELYKEVQKYEDAKDDVTLRKGWRAFKIGLGAALLAGSLALGNYLGNEVKQSLNLTPSNAVVSIETIDKENKEYYENVAEEFADKVRANDGYEFDYLSDDEFLDGYLRILNKESKMIENSFKGAFYNFSDQELLDKIVSRAFEEEYETFTDEQKRDYRQLAFELLPTALPEIFGERNSYIRNPIVCDELQAKNDAKDKGYKITLVVNADEKDTVKAIGKLIHIRNILKAVDFQVTTTNDGQDILEDMVKQALGEEYENLSDKDLRDYIQIAYELLPDEAKQNYIKDPIEVAKAAEDIEIGD